MKSKPIFINNLEIEKIKYSLLPVFIYDLYDIEQSINKIGLISPIVCIKNDKNDVQLVHGHKRLEALKKLQFKSAPVILYNETVLSDQLIPMYLELNKNRKFGIVELAHLITCYGKWKQTDEALKTLCRNQLGMKLTSKIVQRALFIFNMTRDQKNNFFNLNLGFSDCDLLSLFKPEYLDSIFNIFKTIRFTTGERRIFLLYLLDLVNNNSFSPELIFTDFSNAENIDIKKAKGAEFISFIRKLLSPEQEVFLKNLTNLRRQLPTGIKLKMDTTVETLRSTLEISFFLNNLEQLEKKLSDPATIKVLKKINDLVS